MTLLPSQPQKLKATLVAKVMSAPYEVLVALPHGSLKATMKIIASFLFFLTASFAFSALTLDNPEELFLSAYTAFQKAEKFERNNSAADAIQSYREAEKCVKLLRQTHPDWNKPIVDYRARKITDALKRLVPQPEAKKLG